MRPCWRASAAYAESVLSASKCRSRSTGSPSGPRSSRISRMLMKPSSVHPMPGALHKGEPPAGRPAASCPSGDDAPVRAGFAGVGGEGFVSVEMLIALDGKP
jgi:hypothetical protein